MGTASKIGLLPGFGWIANQSWFGNGWWSHLLSTLLVCWGFTPIGHLIWGFVAQATVIPIDSTHQWSALFPGDLYLGGSVAFVIFAAGQMPEQPDRWWQSRSWHIVVLLATFTIANIITWLVDGPGMPLSALLSPSKLYHNFVLYCGYGYVAVVTLVAAVCGNWWSNRLWLVVIALVVVTPYLHLLQSDARLTPAQNRVKQNAAHPASYRLFWVIPIRGEYPPLK